MTRVLAKMVFVISLGAASFASVSSAQAQMVATHFATVEKPWGLGLAPDGNFFATSHTRNKVVNITPSGMASDLNFNDDNPSDLKFYSSGNLYFGSTRYNDQVPQGGFCWYKLNALQRCTWNIAIKNPAGLAVDSDGYIYIADPDNGRVSVIKGEYYDNISTLILTPEIVDNDPQPSAIVIDSTNTIYIAYQGTGKVIKAYRNGSYSVFASGFDKPNGLIFDAGGNLYVAERGTNQVSKITPDGDVSVYVTGLDGPGGMAFDATGTLYVANYDGNSISKIVPAPAAIPTLSEWAMILLALTLAGGAAVIVQRRRALA